LNNFLFCQFCRLLKEAADDYRYRKRYQLLFGALLSVVGESMRTEFVKEEDFIKMTSAIADKVKAAKDKEVSPLGFPLGFTPANFVLFILPLWDATSHACSLPPSFDYGVDAITCVPHIIQVGAYAPLKWRYCTLTWVAFAEQTQIKSHFLPAAFDRLCCGANSQCRPDQNAGVL
jgi:hypothetical protein